ncbi:octopamine receptor beta-2R [Hydra vulgaris]|uniref:Octopamine receptor beta-2R n=1 Tax=Hydra vulgaris TaxID=6087 RepID=A0ABM4CMX0_HYDVU
MANTTTNLIQPLTEIFFPVIGLSFMALFVTWISLYCLIITYKNRKLHTPSNVAICSIILAHLIQGVFVIPLYALKRSNVRISFLTCDTFRFTYMLTNYGACLSLLVVTFDRYLHMKIPLKYRINVTLKRTYVLLLGAWTYTLILCLIPFSNNKNQSDCLYNPTNIWTISMLISNRCVPLIFSIIIYMMIFKKARAMHKDKTVIDNQKCFHINKSNRVFLIITCFLICWGPSVVYYLLESLCYRSCFNKNYHENLSENYVKLVMKMMTFMDGIFAPMIYCIGNRSFKKASEESKKKLKLIFENCFHF